MIYTIKNDKLQVDILSFGASILSMKVFSNNEWHETTVQYENLNDYKNKNTYYLNSIIGPHSGRIKDGKYKINDTVVTLDTNDRGNHLHGSSTGFHTLDFKLKQQSDHQLVLFTKDENNSCDITVAFGINETSLNIEYDVHTYIDQVMNMTQHTYFNLSGEDIIKNHEILVPADKVCFLDASGAPEKLVDVEGAFDLRIKTLLKNKMLLDDAQFEITDNIDHPFLIEDGHVLLESKKTNLGVSISSSAPYVVVYTGNYLLSENEFKNLGPSKKHQAVAIEPQSLPNDVNLGLGRQQVVRANEKYNHKITYKFYELT